MSMVIGENANVNVLKIGELNKIRTFTMTHGVGWLRDIEIDADEEMEVSVEYNFDRRGITKDWALTVWGDKGEITVRHSKGIPSKHFSYTPKANERLAESVFSTKMKTAIKEVTLMAEESALKR